MTNEQQIEVLEKYLNEIEKVEKQEDLTTELVEKLEEILLFLYKNTEDGVFIGRRQEGLTMRKICVDCCEDEDYEDEENEDIEITIYEESRNKETSFYLSEIEYFYTKEDAEKGFFYFNTPSAEDLLYIAKNLKKWILGSIKNQQEYTKYIEEKLQKLSTL